MSTTVDSRVLEMRFDNKEFERNAQQTITTLNNLKRALNEDIDVSAFTNIERAAKNVDLSGIQAGIEVLTDRFSTMGIVGMTVIQNVTNAITNSLGRAINSVTSQITSGGIKRALNIENARFQIQGITKDIQETTRILKDAGDSVDGTAYSYDAAAKAASMFAATGMQSGEEMQKSLKAIAGVAATTNTDYESMANIFTTVAGNGRLMGDQLLQLSNRGLNAAATLKDYFNGVRDGSIEASDAVKAQIAELTGAKNLIQDTTDAINQSSEDVLKNAQKASDAEYKAKQKAYNKEYKALQKSLNTEYNAKKKSYDEQYNVVKKALDDEYNALKESLDKEVEAVQEANNQRVEDAQEAYEKNVEDYRKATEERISLINEEYKESIKLIDEEKYEKLKAVDDKIKAIQDQAKAEQKALKDQANQEKKNYLEEALRNAKGSVTKQKAAEALAELEAQLAREQLAEDRANQIEDLQNEKTKIREEADQKKEEAQKKAESAREAVQEESSAELKAMQKAHQAEMKEMRKEQAEQIAQMRTANAEQLNTLRENQNEQLNNLRESQSNELSIIKEGQQEQLEIYRDKQQEELSDFRETQKEKLNILKESLNDGNGKIAKWAAQLANATEITEKDIRDMVSDGLINFDIFSEAMATTFGDHAKDANKTFTGALDNIKAALSRTGAMFVSPLIEEEGPMVELFNAIRVKINEMNAALATFAGFFTTFLNQEVIPKVTRFVNSINFGDSVGSFYTIRNVLDGILNIGRYLGDVLKAIGKSLKEIMHIDSSSISKAALNFKRLTSQLKVSDKFSRRISKTFNAVEKVFKALWKIIKELINAFSPLTKLFGITINDAGDLEESLVDVISRFADWLATSPKVEKFFAILKTGIEGFVNLLLNARSYITNFKESITGMYEAGSETVSGFIKGISDKAKEIGSVIKDFCLGVISSVKEFFGIKSPSTVMAEIGEWFVEGFLVGVRNLIGNAAKYISESFGKIKQAVIDVFSGLSSRDTDLKGEEIGSNFIMDFIKGVKDNIPNPIEAMKEFFSNMKDKITNEHFGSSTGDSFIKDFIAKIKEGFLKAIDKVKSVFKKVTNKITSVFSHSTETAGEDSGDNFILGFLNTIKEKVSTLSAAAFDGISDGFGGIKDSLPSLPVIAGISASLIALILAVKSIKAGALATLFGKIKGITKIFKLFNTGKKIFGKKDDILAFVNNLNGESQNIGGNIAEGTIAGVEGKMKGVLDFFKNFAQKIIDKVKEIFGIHSPSEVFKNIGEMCVEGFRIGWATLTEKVWPTIQSTVGDLINKVKELFEKGFAVIEEHGPALLSLISGLTVLMMIAKIAKSLTKIVKPFAQIASAIKSIKGVLKGYAWELKADAAVKFAAAIALVVGALTGFIYVAKEVKDIKQLVVLIGGFATVLIAFAVAVKLVIDSLTKLNQGKWSVFGENAKDNALVYIAQGLRKTLAKWGNGSLIKAFATLIGVIAYSVYQIIQMVKTTTKDDLDKAMSIFDKIGGFLLIIATFVLASNALIQKDNTVSVAQVVKQSLNSLGIEFFAIAAGIYLIIRALQEISNIDYSDANNEEYLRKLGIVAIAVAGILTLLALYNLANSAINKLGDGGSTGGVPVIAFCVMLMAVLHAIKQVFEWDLSQISDVKTKVGIIAGAFIAVGILMIILTAIAANGSSEGMHAGGTIIAMCLYLLTACGAVAILGNIPTKAMWKGLGAVLLLTIVVGIAAELAGMGTNISAFKTILAMAAVIGACMVAIGAWIYIEPKELFKAVGAICALLLVIAIVFSQLGKVNTKEGTGKVLAMIAIFAAIGGTLATIDIFGKGNWKSVAAAAVGIGIILLTLSKLFKTLSGAKFDESAMKGIMKGIILLAVIGVVLAAVAILGNDNYKSIAATALGMAAVILIYGVVFKNIANIRADDFTIKEFLKGCLSLLVIGGVLAGVVSVAGLTGASWGQIAATGVALAGVLYVYSLVFKTLDEAVVNEQSIWNFVKGTFGVLVIGMALAGVVAAAGFSGSSWGQILACGVTLSAVVWAYSKIFKDIATVEVNAKSIAGFIAGTLGVFVIGSVLAVMAAFVGDAASIIAAGIGLGVAVWAYGKVFKDIANVDVKWKTIGTFIAGTLGVFLIGLSVAAIANSGNDWAAIAASGLVLAGCLSKYKDVFKELQGVNVKVKDVGKFILGTVAVGIIGYALALVSHDNDWKSIAAAGGSLYGVLKAVGKCINYMNGVKLSWAGLGALLEGLVAVAGVAYILKKFETDNWRNMLATAGSIILVLVGVAVLAAICGALSGPMTAAMGGLTVIGEFLAALEGVLLVIGGLDEATGGMVTRLTEAGGNVLQTFGEAIGKFFGGIVKGVMDPVNEGLVEAGQAMSDFMSNFQGFLDALDGIDDTKVSAAQSLADIFTKLSDATLETSIAGFVDAVTGWIAKDGESTSIEDSMRDLGKGIAAFSEATDGVDGANAEQAAQAVKALTDSLETVEGIDFTKGADIESYSGQLSPFIDIVKDLSADAESLDLQAMTNFKMAAETLFAIGSGVPPENSVFQKFFGKGDNSLGHFGSNVQAFALYVDGINNIITQKTFDKTQFTNFGECADVLLSFGSKVTPENSVFQKFLGKGDNNIGRYGMNVQAFAMYVAGTQNVLTGTTLDAAKFGTFSAIADILFEMSKGVPEMTGPWKKFWGVNKNIDNFGGQVKKFAEHLYDIGGVLKDDIFKSDVFDTLKTISTKVISIGSEFKNISTIQNGDSTKMLNLGSMIETFGKHILDYAKKMKQAGEKHLKGYPGLDGLVEILDKLIELAPNIKEWDSSALEKFLTTMTTVGVKGISEFLSKYTDEQTITKAISTMFSHIGSAITSKKDYVESMGRVTAGYFSTGMSGEEATFKVKTAINALMSSIGTAIMDTRIKDKLFDIGKNAIQGFINGMNDKIEDAKRVSRELGEATYNSTARALQERSPSKKMMQIGSYAGEGFILGFKEWMSAASDTGEDIAQSAQEGLVDALSNIANEIQNEEDFNPVITPVLDLSNVEANARELGGILNLDKPLQLAANAGMSFTGGLNNLLSNIQASIPDNSNEDVVTAINSLRTDINVLGDKVAAMQVVMDTGELVGSIATPVDYQLGFNGILAERGVTR